MLDILTGKLTFKSLKPCDLSNCTKLDIKAYFENSYDLNESLFSALKDESAFYPSPDALRLPLIFYFGHTASVYVNKLMLADLIKPEDRINFAYEALFETGVDEMSWDSTENYRMGGKLQWPSLDDVVDYRRRVRELVLRVVKETPLRLPITMDSPWWSLFMGMEHERIHIETSSVLIRQLPVGLVSQPQNWIYAPLKSGEADEVINPMITMKRSRVNLGKPVDFPSYGWDVEYGSLTCEVPEFEASKYLVTNKEFLHFVTAGGYDDSKFWSKEGWNWVQYRQAKHPTFWICTKGCKSGCGGDLTGYSHCTAGQHLTNRISNGITHETNGISNGTNGISNETNGISNGFNSQADNDDKENNLYRLRVMFDVIDMAWDWPVEVNYLEAKAFCAWKGPGYRLPGEAEHHVIRGPMESTAVGTRCDIIHGDTIQANLNLQFGSSTPVDLYPVNQAGFSDVFGNVWEWVEDHFNGLPGFKTVYLYDDFSSPCFDGKHTNIMGGSWVSTGDEASRFARFSFRRHFFQHSGFRLARSINREYETNKLPIRKVITETFVLGHGTQDPDKIEVDGKPLECEEVATTNNQYLHETQQHLNAMLLQDYGLSHGAAIFSVCNRLIEQHGGRNRGRALHTGCATGATTFCLAKLFDQVLGQDFCARYLDACLTLQTRGSMQYNVSETETTEAKVIDDVDRSRVTFKQLTWLPNEVGYFDFVLATHLDRLRNVRSWMARMREVLHKGGLLITCGDDITKETTERCLSKHFNIVEDILLNLTGRTSDTSHKVHLTAWKHIAT